MVGGGQDLNYQEQINQRISDLGKSYGGRIVTLQRDLGIVSNDIDAKILNLREEVNAKYAQELETVQSTISRNNSQIQQLDILIQALRNEEPQRDANTREYVDRNLSRTIQQTESSINSQLNSVSSNLYQLNDRLSNRVNDLDVLLRKIQYNGESINGQISSFTSNLSQLNDRLSSRMIELDLDLNLKITQVRDQLGGLIEQQIQKVESRILELERK